MANDKSELLLRSTAVVIDDDIEDQNSEINKIVEALSQEGTLFVKLKSCPEDVSGFINASFIILDWKYDHPDIPEGVELGAEFYKQNEAVMFIRSIINNFYIPILIFSAEDQGIIKSKLLENKELEHALDTGRISVYKKDELLEGNIVSCLTKWLEDNLAAHLFKHMESIIRKTEHSFFIEFDSFNKDWPSHVYYTIDQDEPADINLEFQEFILSTFANRIEGDSFEGNFVRGCNLRKDEIIKIYNGIKIVSYERMQPIGAHCGDIYCKVDNNGKPTSHYAINITAPCDIRGKNMLFLKGQRKEIDLNPLETGRADRVYLHTIYQVLGNDEIIFNFRENEKIIIDDKNVSTISLLHNNKPHTWNRVGRLIHPYITNLQDRFAYYIIRRGITRTPNYNVPANGRDD